MRAVAGVLAALLLVGSLAVAGAQAATADSSHRSGGGSGGPGGTGSCDPYVDGTIIPVPCSAGGGGGGAGGTGGGGGTTVDEACQMLPLDEAQAKSLGLAWPPPAGQHWALLDCFGGGVGPGPQAVLVNNVTGAPEVTPQELLVQALGELRIPYPRPATAPPRGRDGLVGLPEWFWVPAGQWRTLRVTVTAGPVWATVTAVPVGLTFQPGAGLSPVSCAGPGTAYDPHTSAVRQHTDCSYTYFQPSAGQPGGAYHASLTATWRISWVGSGGAGGLLDAALAVPAGFDVPVAQGEALVTSP